MIIMQCVRYSTAARIAAFEMHTPIAVAKRWLHSCCAYLHRPVLLHTRAEVIITGKTNAPLQGVMIYLSNKRQQNENDDILLRISVTSSAVVGAGRIQSMIAALFDKFNRAKEQLKGGCIHCV
jgi:hypothetical protein